MKKYIGYFLKGFGVGAANVIPGVSGGTVALITGIFERMINAIKSFDLKAVKLLFKGEIKQFIEHTDLLFLIAVFAGAVVSIFSLAKLLGWLFIGYPVYVWSYFFGLILASVFFVGKNVSKFNLPVILSFIVGTGIAVYISMMDPAAENTSTWYLLICGVVAIISMILPGLSGSFVLILLGNYQLVMIDSVSTFNLEILIPVGIGAAVGLPAFSHVLSWIFKKFKDQTLSLLTGFILGSLSILWPWKKPIYLTDDNGIEIVKSSGDPIIKTYERFIPEAINLEVFIAISLLFVGIFSVWLLEKVAADKDDGKEVSDELEPEMRP